jgi:SAM-dependent methyltransferase
MRTSYPAELVQEILRIKGHNWLEDEIARDEDPFYLELILKRELFAYFPPEAFAGARVLDFGCGAGASTMVLARLLPEAEIVGVELDPELLRLARARLDFYRFPHVRLLPSPSPTTLPSECEAFDFIVMSAVYEHLLPEERVALMPLLLEAIRPGGHLFLNQTPHRFFPIEAHTTGFPLLNYLPDFLTLRLVRWFSGVVPRDESWPSLLRRGIRGATEREILRNLGPSAVLIEPRQGGLRDRIDLWYSCLSPRYGWIKSALRRLLRLILRVTGTALVPTLALAFQRLPDHRQHRDQRRRH